jgi:phosphotriesterase-related protein
VSTLNIDQRPADSSIPNIAGKVMTVNGAGDPDRLGLTIMHEHLFIDLWKDKIPPHNAPATEAVLWDQKLSLQNLHLARQSKPIKDNYILGDEAVAIAEAMEFKKNGGSTIVEVTSIGIGRDPMALRRVANATGMNVVMGTGWYQKAYHPDDIDQRTVDDMAAEIVRDVTVGVGDTGIRSGIIGEVGINGEPLTPNEIKSLQASARASRATGAAISLHRGGAGREKLEVVSILGKEGADMSRVIFGHSDSIAWDMPLMLELLNHGVYIQFDTLGMESTSLFLHPRSHSGDEIMGLARTPQAVEAIPKLIEMGYEDRILLSQDVCTKTQLKRYGGNGYSFILERVLPTLRRKGVTEDQVNSLMVDNPRRVLAFAEPS